MYAMNCPIFQYFLFSVFHVLVYGCVAMQKCIGLLVWGTYTIFVYDICGLKVSADTFSAYIF